MSYRHAHLTICKYAQIILRTSVKSNVKMLLFCMALSESSIARHSTASSKEARSERVSMMVRHRRIANRQNIILLL
jgi:hypothetical protein